MTVSAGTRIELPAEPAAAESAAREPCQPARAGLIWTLVRTDFKVRYHGTVGGFVWALLKPLAMFVMLMGVFSFLFASEPNYKLNLIIGLFLWDFFASGTIAGMGSLQSRGFLLTKARCPAWILIVCSISNALITYSLFSVIILVFLVLIGQPPGPAATLLFLIYGVAMTMVIVGFSLAASVLFLRYRDLNQIWDMALQAGFFVAPIIYPISILPERYHVYLYLWAPTPLIQFTRSVLVDGRVPTLTAHLYLTVAVALCLAIGTVIYRRLGPRAAEYL
jgi:lipopolysaccharide transport system permease protein